MESKKHILLKYATTYDIPRNISLAPENCHYDRKIGAWVVSESGVLLVNSPDKPKPVTKKADIETGEDQKGE